MGLPHYHLLWKHYAPHSTKVVLIFVAAQWVSTLHCYSGFSLYVNTCLPSVGVSVNAQICKIFIFYIMFAVTVCMCYIPQLCVVHRVKTDIFDCLICLHHKLNYVHQCMSTIISS